MFNQQVDRIVNFFRINHSFHEPFQFLIDGNFISLLVEKELDLQHKINQAIKGRSSLLVTSCVIRELELLGDHFRVILDQAHRFRVVSCKHSLEQSVDQCLLERVGNDNERQYIICSQDIGLRRSLRLLGNVPIMYFGPDQRITMEDIHKKSLEAVQQEIKNKYLPKASEMKEVNEHKKKQMAEEKQLRIRQLSSEHGIKIKTKVVRGPNPLSNKKKQLKEHVHQQAPSESGPKAKRIRKRKAKSTAQV